MARRATSSEPWVDVSVRFHGSVLGTRRLGGKRSDAGTPLRVGLLAIALGLSLLALELLVGYGWMFPLFEPVVLGGGLVGLGLVGFVVGLQRRAEPDPRAFWMGPASDVDVALDRPGIADRLAVVRIAGNDVELQPPQGFRVFEGEAELLRTDVVRMGSRSALVLRDEDVEIEVRRAKAGPVQHRFGRLDLRLAAGLVVAACVIGGTIMLAHYVVPDPLSLSVPVEHTAHGIPRDP